MGLDDLLGDREAEAGILAEALVRPIGVEALEDLLERIGLDARPLVVDDDLDLAACSRRQVTRTLPPGGENERALSIRLLTTWPRRKSWPGTTKDRAGCPRTAGLTVTPSSWRTSLAMVTRW